MMHSLFFAVISFILIGQTFPAVTRFYQGNKYVKISSYGSVTVGRDLAQEPENDTDDGDNHHSDWVQSNDPSEVKVRLMSAKLLNANGVVVGEDTFETNFQLQPTSTSDLEVEHPEILNNRKGMTASIASWGADVWFGASAVVRPGTMFPKTPMEVDVDGDTVAFDVRFVQNDGDGDCAECRAAESLELNLQLTGEEPYKVALHPEPGTKLVEMGGDMAVVLPGRYVKESGFPSTRGLDVKQEAGDSRPVVNVKVVIPLDNSAGKNDVTWGGRIELNHPNSHARENHVLPQDGGDESKDDSPENGAGSLSLVASITLAFLASIFVL